MDRYIPSHMESLSSFKMKPPTVASESLLKMRPPTGGHAAFGCPRYIKLLFVV